ncbi:MAG TPA: hypothetical protein VHR66_05695 [Gemmataceae bacterium]|nr:hypothetical protein [Gemmataceae bacterium]
MIPQHILDDLGLGQRVAILARAGELEFRVHPAAADPDRIRADAGRDGCEVVATHLNDKAAILALVAGRERDVGGEG